MFGDQMLIAPVTAPMKGDYSTLNVWLPAGTDWYEWHTGTMLKGGQTVTRAFAIDEYPIYIKAGSILPFCDRVKSLADDDLSYVVTVFPGGDGAFELYEDNGNDKEYDRKYACTSLLSPGDILIDGGNSNYEDTNRRVKLAESKGFLFVGSGVSGGEEGALNGASIMPGGSEKAWPEVKPILQSIAAKAPDGTPCCQWVGPAGSGHFVKMIHNGIEYGDMQLIAEAYWVMKKLLDLTNEEMADVFARWNEGKLRSYLIEITANILRHKDKSGGYLIDKILDAAGQKGTGKWSVINAMELGMPLGLIATAVFERSLSAQKDLRHLASRQYQCQHTQPIYNKVELVKNIFSALYASKLVSYAQGFAVLHMATYFL